VRLRNSAVPSHASQVIGVIDCTGPHKDEDASIVALHYQHPPAGPPISEEATRIAAANKYVRWTNVENLSRLGSGGIVRQLIEHHPDKDFWPLRS
jgi:hypothetical protein